MTRSLPYFISPLLLSISTLFFGFKYVFLLTGLIMLVGVRYTLIIKDDDELKKEKLAKLNPTNTVSQIDIATNQAK
jgi:hypothetical protein